MVYFKPSFFNLPKERGVILPLYRPVDVYPSFDVINATEDCEFTWRIKGTECTKYKIQIFKSDGTTVGSAIEVLPSTPYYNNEFIRHLIPSGTMSNGNSYSWELSLWGDNYDTLAYTNGKCSVGGSGATRYINTNLLSSSESNIERVAVGNHVYMRGRSSSSWVNCGQITSHYSYNEIIRIETSIPLPNYDGNMNYIQIFSNKLTITPNYVFEAKDKPIVNINTITPLHITAPQKTFTATYSHPQNVRFLRYYWELYQDGVKIDETGYLTDNDIKYSYGGFIKEGTGRYELKLHLEDVDTKKATASKEYNVVLDNKQEETGLIVTKKLNDDYSEMGCIEVDWSAISNPNNYPVVITRDENGSGIFRHIATVLDANKIRDYAVKGGGTYRYKICISGSAANIISTSDPIEYKSGSWHIIGLNKFIENGLYEVSDSDVWSFKLNIESSEMAVNDSYNMYNTLSKHPKFSQGKNNYVSSQVSFLLGDVSCSGEYTRDNYAVLKQWKDFCKEDTVKMIKTNTGEILLCKLHDLTYINNNTLLQSPTKISFSYTEIMDNKVSVISGS